jgi:pyridoxal phosphate enzyme (YggS family)
MSIARLAENLESVRTNIRDAARRSGRDESLITLVAVTKRRSETLVRGLSEIGVTDFGENYPQELWEKVQGLAGLPARWHLIGHLQGNKAKKTLGLVRWIHGVDSLKLLKTLDGLAAEMDSPPPSVCLQLNASNEESKHGWTPEGLLADAEAIAACRAIPIVGLMTMAAYGTDAETARPSFALTRSVRDQLLERTGLPLKHLSMGMSNDYEAAIEEGATLVRVGSALFEGLDP